MKILHVCQSDSRGGAAIAARRLHDALRAAGVDSRMLVLRKTTEDPTIRAPLGRAGVARVRAARFLAKRIGQATARFDPAGMRSFALAPTGMGRAIAREGADIVHIHWVGGETMSLSEIAGIEAPLVWTLHDMWGFSGAHHQGVVAERLFPGRGPLAGLTPDPDVRTANRRAHLLGGRRIGFICPSAWMSDRLSESSGFGGAPRTVIPNTLDPQAFRPGNRAEARRALGLPQDGPLILFGAVGGADDPVKGGDFLAPILAAVEAHGLSPRLAVFGGAAPEDLAGRCRTLGVLQGDAALATAYRAADVFLCPSRIESFCNTIVEAQSCGVPAAAFASAGQVDAIGDPDRLAEPFDCAALGGVVARLLRSPADPERIRAATLARIGPEAVAARTQEAYAAALSAAGPPAGAGGA